MVVIAGVLFDEVLLHENTAEKLLTRTSPFVSIEQVFDLLRYTSGFV